MVRGTEDQHLMNLELVWRHFKFLSPFRICLPLSLFGLPQSCSMPCPREKLGGCDDATACSQCFSSRRTWNSAEDCFSLVLSLGSPYAGFTGFPHRQGCRPLNSVALVGRSLRLSQSPQVGAGLARALRTPGHLSTEGSGVGGAQTGRGAPS